MSDKINAVLVKLSVRIFTNTREDRAISEEVRKKKALGIGAGKWVKHIFPKEALNPIKEIGGETRRRHYDMTLPWEDGLRLLNSKAHESYKDQMHVFANRFFKAVDEFGANYDEWTSKARKMHGKTFDANLYPEWPRMRQLFSVGQEFQPIPRASHFITQGIAKEACEQMKEDLEAANKVRIDAAVKDTFNRVLIPVQEIANKLTDTEKPTFRDSLIGNVKDILALVPLLNLTDDADLKRIAEEMQLRFANIDPDELRNNNSVRMATASHARLLASRFGQVGKRRFA